MQLLNIRKEILLYRRRQSSKKKKRTFSCQAMDRMKLS